MMPREGEVVSPEIETLRSGREFLKNCLIPLKEIDGKKPSKQQRKAYAKLWADEWGFHPQNHPNAWLLHVSCIEEGDEVPQRIY